MKLKTFKNGKPYYLTEKEEQPIDNIPCYSNAEMALMIKYKDKLTPELLDQFYATKMIFGAHIISLMSDVIEKEKAAEVEAARGIHKLDDNAKTVLNEIYATLKGMKSFEDV